MLKAASGFCLTLVFASLQFFGNCALAQVVSPTENPDSLAQPKNAGEALRYFSSPGHIARVLGHDVVKDLYKPNLFSTSIVDGAAHFSTKYVMFQFAVAVSTYWDCASSGQKVKCDAFMKALEDPGTALGFYFFESTARSIRYLPYFDYSMRVPGLKHLTGSLPIAAGLMVDNLFGEFWRSDEFQVFSRELRAALENPKRWSEVKPRVMKALYDRTVKNPEWWSERVPSFLSMWGAGALVHKGLATAEAAIVQQKGALVSQRAALRAAGKFEEAEKLTRAIGRLGVARNVARNFNLVKGFRVLYRAGRIVRINWVVFVAMTFVETEAFLFMTHAIEENWKLARSRSEARNNLTQSISRLTMARYPFYEAAKFVPSQWLKPGEMEKGIAEVHENWDKLRRVYRTYAIQVVMNYQNMISQYRKKFQKINSIYSWIVEGADANKKATNEKGEHFYVLESEKREFLSSFFCGPKPENSIIPATRVFGVALPYMTTDVAAYRVVDYEGLNKGQVDYDYYCRGPSLTRYVPAGRAGDAQRAVHGLEVQNILFRRQESAVRSGVMPHLKIQAAGGLLKLDAKVLELENTLAKEYQGANLEAVNYSFMGSKVAATNRHDNSSRPDQFVSFVNGIIPSLIQEQLFWKHFLANSKRSIPEVDAILTNLDAEIALTSEIYQRLREPKEIPEFDRRMKDLSPNLNQNPELVDLILERVIPAGEDPAEIREKEEAEEARKEQIRARRKAESLSGR